MCSHTITSSNSKSVKTTDLKNLDYIQIWVPYQSIGGSEYDDVNGKYMVKMNYPGHLPGFTALCERLPGFHKQYWQGAWE